MKVTMLLADFAEAINGKLYIMGGGWSVVSAGPSRMAIAIKIDVPWDRTNTRHSLVLELLDGDGAAVSNDEGKPIRVDLGFEVGRPPGLRPGTPIDVPLAVNIQRGQLESDTRYLWNLSIDGHSEDDWQCSFTTRPA